MPLNRQYPNTETKELPSSLLPVTVLSDEKRVALLQLQARLLDALTKAIESEHYAVAVFNLNGNDIELSLLLNNFILADHADAVDLLEQQLQRERIRVRGTGELLREEVPPDVTDMNGEMQ